MPRTVLIVDDNDVNRQILRKILSAEYQVAEACDGQVALEMLREHPADYSAVMLDLIMPVLDGYEVLTQMRQDKRLSLIPVLVMTGSDNGESEVRALTLGANDYILKPYKASVIRHRLANTINLRETAALVNAIERDELTGLLSRPAFFQRAASMIDARENGYYILCTMNINGFKIINDQYGNDMGDRVLVHAASTFRAALESIGGVCCRITADDFAALYPAQYAESEILSDCRREAGKVEGLAQPVVIRIGRYRVTDKSLSVSAMYDRATMAEDSIKGRFDVQAAYYDESMRERILREQEIVNEMNHALDEKQFEVWLQPQYNHATGALVGAEALVRWRHPVKGLISPGLFIPVFERNGFVYEVDKFVWRSVCEQLRAWLDAGRSPTPISVNASRYDVLRDGFFTDFMSIVRQYRIPVQLLRLEITESAFANDSARLISIVKRLKDEGFTIEIDDFGSGYSSLNTLKDVPADIIKLDMRFLEGEDNMQRGGNILESIVRMARWLGMPVIAEGVETKPQADYLKSIGCYYIQGYLYARPMPCAEFEALAANAGKEEHMRALETVSTLDNNAFWDPSSMDTLIFNSYVGCACIFEYQGANVELLRVNDKFVTALGGSLTTEDVLAIHFAGHLDKQNRAIAHKALQNAIRTGGEVTCEVLFTDLPKQGQHTCQRANLRIIAVAGERYLVYCTSEDITAQREAEQRVYQTSERLQAIMDNVTCGITAVIADDESVRDIFVNNRFYELLGYTRSQYNDEVHSPYDVVYPDDRELLRRRVRDVNWTGETAQLEYRAIRRDRSVAWLRASIALVRFYGISEPVQLGNYIDVTEEKRAQSAIQESSWQLNAIMRNINGGVTAVTVDATDKVRYIFSNDQYYEQLGYTRDQLAAEVASPFDLVHPADRERVIELTRVANETRSRTQIVYRAIRRDGSVVWLQSNIAITAVEGIDEPVQISVANDITEQRSLELHSHELSKQLQAIMQSLNGGLSAATLVDGRVGYLFVNDKYYEMFGYTKQQFERELPDGIVDLILPEDLPTVYRVAAECERTHEPVTFEFRARKRTGEIIFLHVNSSICVLDSAQAPLHIAVLNDVTKEKESERKAQEFAETIRKLNESLTDMMNDTPGGITRKRVGADGVSRMEFVNRGFCDMLGFERDDIMRRYREDMLWAVHPSDREALLSGFQKLLEMGTTHSVKYRLLHSDGQYHWTMVFGRLVKREHGEAYVNSYYADLTGQMENEELVRMDEEKFRIAAAASDRTVARYDIRKKVYHNDSKLLFEQGFGETIENAPEVFVERGIVQPACVDDFLAFYKTLGSGAKTASATVALRVPDGRFPWFGLEGTTIFDAYGKPSEAIIVFHDVSEEREKDVIYRQWQQSLVERSRDSFTLFRCNLGKTAAFDSVQGELLKVRFTNDTKTFDERTAEYAEQYVHPDDRAAYVKLLSTETLLALYAEGKRHAEITYRELGDDGERLLRLRIELVEYPGSTDVEAYLMYLKANGNADVR